VNERWLEILLTPKRDGITVAELCAISSGVQGVPPFLGRYTLDTHHTPAYAAGYLAKRANPRLFMTCHMPFDPYLNEETTVEIRHHWKGPFHFGAPDGVVVNATKDDIWREPEGTGDEEDNGGNADEDNERGKD